MTAREVLKLLKKDGWYVLEQHGSHIQMKHRAKKGKVSVPNHLGDIPLGTLRSVLAQAGLKQEKK
ncbi:MAG: type II toxin-antitoxin system HicA family toxin [Treponema sp.]|nr:type II toxin-antitoxin system HicA family toxin [Treponema sp.]